VEFRDLHSAFGGYSNFWNRNCGDVFGFGLGLVLFLMDPWSGFAVDFGLCC